MNRHLFWRFCACLLILAFGTLTLFWGCFRSNVDVTKLLGNLKLPQEANRTEWAVSLDNATLTLGAKYDDITLPIMLKFMQALVDDNWYLSENSAFLGNRSLVIAYDYESQRLQLNFTQLTLQAEWPKSVLSPYLSHITPVFAYGTYASFQTRELPNVESATMHIYNNVAASDMEAYEKTLLNAGYAFDKETDGQRFFKKNTAFVTLTLNTPTKQAAIIVGSFRVYAVALPPWPDPLPQTIKRILAPVPALCKVEKSQDGFAASAQDLTLTELYHFVKALTSYYGWTEPNDKGALTHAAANVGMQVVSFGTAANKLTFRLSGTGTNTPSPSANPSPVPSSTFRDEGFDDGLPDYDFRLTKGTYSDKDAMDGILSEFGQTAEMANWEEIKSRYADRFDAFLNYVGVVGNEDVWLLYKKSGYDGIRHYFLARISGVSRANFKLYDSVGNEAWLGSWYGINLRILVKVQTSGSK